MCFGQLTKIDEQLGRRAGDRVFHSAARDYRHGAQFKVQWVQNFGSQKIYV